jgi:hypothetical protein
MLVDNVDQGERSGRGGSDSPAPSRTSLDDDDRARLDYGDILERADDVEYPVLVRALSAARTPRTRMGLVVRVEHVDGRVAAVAEVRDGVGVERAEVEVALGRGPPRERARIGAQRHAGRDRHHVLPPAPVGVGVTIPALTSTSIPAPARAVRRWCAPAT